MTEMHRSDEIYGEVNLRAVLRDMYRRKWQVLGLTLLAGVAAALLTLFIPNKYSSSAALIIREPQSPITGDVEPLSVETLQNLAESTDVKWMLFEKLWDAKALAKWQDDSLNKEDEFRGFQDSLSTQLKKQESRGGGGAVSLLPVLVIMAEAESPEEAQTIANEWVGIVTERCQTIYTEGVEDLDVFIADVYERADTKLVKEEANLSQKTSDADLDFKKARFETSREKAITLEAEIFTLDVEIRTNTVLMAEIEQRLAEQEYQGVWLGDAAEDLYLEGKLDEIDLQNASPLAVRILQNVRTAVDKNNELLDFTTTSRMEALKGEAMALEVTVNDANESVSTKRLELAQSLHDLEYVRGALAEQEINGVWIGELLSQYYRQEISPVDVAVSGGEPAPAVEAPSTAGPAASVAPMDGMRVIAKPAVTEQTKRLDDITRDVIQREVALLKYQQESAIEFKTVQLALFENELEQVLSDKDRAQKALVLGETRLAFLKPELENQPQKISLDKAITDDVLWQEYLQADKANGNGKSILTPLKTEVLNPTHQRAQDLVLDLTAETVSLKQEIEFVNQREPELRSSIDSLRAEIAAIDMEVLNQREAIDTQRSVLKVMAMTYAANKEREETLNLANRQAQEAIEAMEQARDEAYQRYREKGEEVDKIDNQIRAKKSNLASVRSTLDVMGEDYRSERTMLETLRLKQVRNKLERELKSTILTSSTEESEKLQLEIATITQELNKINREVEKLEGVRSTLATRAEEVALLKVSSQNASRSGTTTFYRAQANPRKVALSGSSMVAVSMLATLMICGFLIYLSALIRSGESGAPAKEAV